MNKNHFIYHLFLFLSIFGRTFIGVYSLILLYQNGASFQQIILFLIGTYLVGIISSFISIQYNKKIILFVSNIIYGISFLYLTYFHYSLFFLCILIGFGNYSYHTIRHYYAFYMLKDKNQTSGIVSMMYLGTCFSSLIGGFLLDKLSPLILSFIVFFILFLSSFPIFLFQDDHQFIGIDSFKKVKVGKRKIIFSILEQFKVLFMELQPLFIYLYVRNSYSYIGIFQVVVNLSSLLVIFWISRYVSFYQFKYVSIFLGIILLLKLHFNHDVLMFVVAILEGVFIKLYEVFSLRNLYDRRGGSVSSYLMFEEFVFLSSKIVILFVCFLIGFSFKWMLHLFILGIIVSGFFI